MSKQSSPAYELDDLESDLKDLPDDLFLDDVGEWMDDVKESGESENDDDYNKKRGQVSRNVKRRKQFNRSKVRKIGFRRDDRFPYRGKYRSSFRKNCNVSGYRQFNKEKCTDSREVEWRTRNSLKRSDSDSSIRRNEEYPLSRREDRLNDENSDNNENDWLQNQAATENSHSKTLFDKINTLTGLNSNEIPGLEFTGTHNEEQNKLEFVKDKIKERNKKQDHSPKHLHNTYSDRISLSPPHSSKRHSLERTHNSASHYNENDRTSSGWYRSRRDSRRHRSRSLSPRSDHFNKISSPHYQRPDYNRWDVSSKERYYGRTDLSPRKSVSISPDRNRKQVSSPSPQLNTAPKSEWYPEVESNYQTQPSSSDYQNSHQLPGLTPYSGPVPYGDAVAPNLAYGANYRNYNQPDYQLYPGYNVNSTSYYQQQPPPGPSPMQPYMQSANPQDYAGPAVCQDHSWPPHSDTAMPYVDPNHPPPEMSVCPPQETFQIASSGNCPLNASGNSSNDDKKKEAVQNELKQQRRTLAKQREEYYCKSSTFRQELELLQNQKKELVAEKLPENEKILKENQKLQVEIQNKLKAIANVTEMLSGIIGDDKDLIEEFEEEKKKKKNTEERVNKQQNKSPEKPSVRHDRNVKVPSPPLLNYGQNNKTRVSDSHKFEEQNVHESEKSTSTSSDPSNQNIKGRYNYVHYDPEMHWCRVCNIFPKTAKEYLNHLHSAEHKGKTLEKNLVDMPWHKNQNTEETPHYPGAPVKRLPIRGLQFFISATAWYCKLCDVWIGDLHCASIHLKSAVHSQRYSAFTEQNPHWEVDWLADRTRAYERSSEDRQKLTENSNALNGSSSLRPFNDKDSKENTIDLTKSLSDQLMAALKENNKKRSRKRSRSSNSSSSDSSSSSSTSDNSSDQEVESIDKAHSIRVAMRNKEVPSTKSSKFSSDIYTKNKYNSPGKEIYRENRRNSIDDKMLHEWMEVSVIDKDRDMINNLKDRLKQKQEIDREIERKKQHEKRRSMKEDHRRYDDRPMKDDQRRYDDRKKSYDDVRKRYTNKCDFEERHLYRRSEKSPEKRTDRSKYEKCYSKTESTKSDQKDIEKHSSKSETICTSVRQTNKSLQEENDSDNNESSLEKLTAESAAKKKDIKKNILPFKSKLPFIGRMPFIGKIPAMKKKNEADSASKENKNEEKLDPSKQVLVWPDIPKVDDSQHLEPLLREDILRTSAPTSQVTPNISEATVPSNTTITSSAITTTAITNTTNTTAGTAASTSTTTTIFTSNTIAVNASSKNNSHYSNNNEHILPRSTLILSKTPGVTVKSIPLPKKKKMLDDGIAGGVEDMDIEVEENELSEENLPKDFQDALDILFPTEAPPTETLPGENESVTGVSTPLIETPTMVSTMSLGSDQNNTIQNNEMINNSMNCESGQRNMLVMGLMSGIIQQFGMNNASPVGSGIFGGPGQVDTGCMSSGGQMTPLLGPGPMEHSQMGLKHNLANQRQIGSEPEIICGRQLDQRPDFNRMGSCHMGPGPDCGLDHISRQQLGGLESVIPQGLRPIEPMCPGIMGPGPMGPGPPMVQGPRVSTQIEPRPPMGLGSGIPVPTFGDDSGEIEADHMGGVLGLKRKNRPSQKKRHQMKRRRDLLEAREKELNEKIAELKGNLPGDNNVSEVKDDPDKKKRDSMKMELAMLGIDEDDICCN